MCEGARHPGDPGMARASLGHEHGRVHGSGAEPVQGLLERLSDICRPIWPSVYRTRRWLGRREGVSRSGGSEFL
jgi:hypothetical protein